MATVVGFEKVELEMMRELWEVEVREENCKSSQ